MVHNERINGTLFICPECEADLNFKMFNYCPSCGVKLVPSEDTNG